MLCYVAVASLLFARPPTTHPHTLPSSLCVCVCVYPAPSLASTLLCLASLDLAAAAAAAGSIIFSLVQGGSCRKFVIPYHIITHLYIVSCHVITIRCTGCHITSHSITAHHNSSHTRIYISLSLALCSMYYTLPAMVGEQTNSIL